MGVRASICWPAVSVDGGTHLAPDAVGSCTAVEGRAGADQTRWSRARRKVCTEVTGSKSKVVFIDDTMASCQDDQVVLASHCFRRTTLELPRREWLTSMVRYKTADCR